MTKKEFIARFELTATQQKCRFNDGRKSVERTLYSDPHGKWFVFYGNDLHTFTKFNSPSLQRNDGIVNGFIGAGYSWYR